MTSTPYKKTGVWERPILGGETTTFGPISEVKITPITLSYIVVDESQSLETYNRLKREHGKFKEIPKRSYPVNIKNL